MDVLFSHDKQYLGRLLIVHQSVQWQHLLELLSVIHV